ncbi:hypothetical protein HDV00_006962, partial [Rhizophlyctis rosea]
MVERAQEANEDYIFFKIRGGGKYDKSAKFTQTCVKGMTSKLFDNRALSVHLVRKAVAVAGYQKWVKDGADDAERLYKMAE